jgi:hypothetical protein
LGQRLANFSGGIVALFLSMINASWPACSKPAIPLDPDGFTNTVAQALNALAIPAPARVTSPLTLTARDSTGTEIQINLDRIYSACKTDQQRCPDFIRNLITGAADALQASHAPPTPATLRAVVRPEAYLRNNPQLAQVAIRVARRELPEGLVALIYVDKARAMGTVSARELVEMHLSTDGAYRLGLRNVAADLRPIDQAIKALPLEESALCETVLTSRVDFCCTPTGRRYRSNSAGISSSPRPRPKDCSTPMDRALRP